MFEILIGLNVIDEDGYQKYRDEMTPILESVGGEFRYDFTIKKTLKSETENNINRFFIMSFPNEQLRKDFFNYPDYKAINKQYLKSSVTDITMIAEYDAD